MDVPPNFKFFRSQAIIKAVYFTSLNNAVKDTILPDVLRVS